ncbi:hypothetical protein HY772_01040 [Candidatus Woesearchaeota archaeon]|nr:hypothetical protein [Candidatus Woesearchaeota archaeon]
MGNKMQAVQGARKEIARGYVTDEATQQCAADCLPGDESTYREALNLCTHTKRDKSSYRFNNMF